MVRADALLASLVRTDEGCPDFHLRFGGRLVSSARYSSGTYGSILARGFDAEFHSLSDWAHAVRGRPVSVKPYVIYKGRSLREHEQQAQESSVGSPHGPAALASAAWPAAAAGAPGAAGAAPSRGKPGPADVLLRRMIEEARTASAGGADDMDMFEYRDGSRVFRARYGADGSITGMPDTGQDTGGGGFASLNAWAAAIKGRPVSVKPVIYHRSKSLRQYEKEAALAAAGDGGGQGSGEEEERSPSPLPRVEKKEKEWDHAVEDEEAEGEGEEEEEWEQGEESGQEEAEEEEEWVEEEEEEERMGREVSTTKHTHKRAKTVDDTRSSLPSLGHCTRTLSPCTQEGRKGCRDAEGTTVADGGSGGGGGVSGSGDGGGGVNDEELYKWSMDGKGGSVAYFIMDGKRQMKVAGREVPLRELGRSGLKTRGNGHWAEIVRAEQAWFLLRQSGKAHELGVGESDRRLFYALLSKGDELAFSSVKTLVLYKRTRVLGKHRNEAGFYLDLGAVRAARFVSDLTNNWGSEFVSQKDTCDGVAISDSSLVVLSGPFKHIINKERGTLPSVTPSNKHGCGGPFFCTFDDVRESLVRLSLSDTPSTVLSQVRERVCDRERDRHAPPQRRLGPAHSHPGTIVRADALLASLVRTDGGCPDFHLRFGGKFVSSARYSSGTYGSILARGFDAEFHSLSDWAHAVRGRPVSVKPYVIYKGRSLREHEQQAQESSVGTPHGPAALESAGWPAAAAAGAAGAAPSKGKPGPADVLLWRLGEASGGVGGPCLDDACLHAENNRSAEDSIMSACESALRDSNTTGFASSGRKRARPGERRGDVTVADNENCVESQNGVDCFFIEEARTAGAGGAKRHAYV
jgi:hypothetical protein